MPAPQRRRRLEPWPVFRRRPRRHGGPLHRRRHVCRQLRRRARGARQRHHHALRLVALQQHAGPSRCLHQGLAGHRHPRRLRLRQRRSRMVPDQRSAHQFRRCPPRSPDAFRLRRRSRHHGVCGAWPAGGDDRRHGGGFPHGARSRPARDGACGGRRVGPQRAGPPDARERSSRPARPTARRRRR